uniref:Uncharacterized protein n=1 Tax=Rhizophora mucronata TaxID=61149 RepID=A0A2P2KG63_RHIMU
MKNTETMDKFLKLNNSVFLLIKEIKDLPKEASVTK